MKKAGGVILENNQQNVLVEKMTFEEAMKALEDIVSRLESGQVDLETSIQYYERGAALKAHCATKLKAAEQKIEKIITQDSVLDCVAYGGAEEADEL
jgi:exodeoxyribonuclease VII small subunit